MNAIHEKYQLDDESCGKLELIPNRAAHIIIFYFIFYYQIILFDGII